MILALAAWLVVTAGIGYATVESIWPGPVRWRSSEAALRASLVVGLGFGVSSCGLFIGLLFFGPTRLAGPGVDLVMLVALGLLARARRGVGKRRGERTRLPAAPPPDRLDRGIAWAIGLMVAVGLLATASDVLAMPHGGWDGWGIYGLTARFIYLAGPAWHRAFTAGIGLHPDYPLLVPGSTVRGWLYAGRNAAVVPLVMGVLFAYATIGLLVSSLWVLRGRRHAALAAVALLGTPLVLANSASQYADLPLVFFFLAAIVLFALAVRLREDTVWLLVGSGFCVGLAAWTKNEGLLYVLVLSVAMLAMHHRVVSRRSHRRALLAFFSGLIPVLVMIVYFKLALAPPNDLVSGQGSGTLPRVLDLSRYATIIISTLHRIPKFPLIPVLIFLAFVGVDREADDGPAVGLALFAFLALSAGYFAVYVVTPLALHAQIGRSMDRLMLQLWPLLLFVVFMLARVREQGRDAPPSAQLTKHASDPSRGGSSTHGLVQPLGGE